MKTSIFAAAIVLPVVCSLVTAAIGQDSAVKPGSTEVVSDSTMAADKIKHIGDYFQHLRFDLTFRPKDSADQYSDYYVMVARSRAADAIRSMKQGISTFDFSLSPSLNDYYHLMPEYERARMRMGISTYGPRESLNYFRKLPPPQKDD